MTNNDDAGSDIIDCDADPFVYEGMVVYSHNKGGKVSWGELQPALWQWDRQKVDDGISGHLLLRELEGKEALNANVLWFLLKNSELIPEEWKEDKYICFWGTVYLNSRSGLCVSSLAYGERGWDVQQKYLDEMFGAWSYAVLGRTKA